MRIKLFFGLLLSVLWGGKTKGQHNFASSPILISTGYSNYGQRNFLEAADLNGDGIPDLATTNGGGSNAVSLMMIDRNGNQIGMPHMLTTTTVGLYGIVLADFDSDGDNDVAVARENQGISVWLNNGTGSFSPEAVYNIPGPFITGVRVIRSIDYDEDGDLDIVTYVQETSPIAHKLVFFNNNGAGIFVFSVSKTIPDPFPFTIPPYNTMHDLAVGIFDVSTNKPEVLFTCAGSGSDNNVFRLYNLASPSPSVSCAIAVAGGYPLYNANTDIEVGDIDLDGITDIVIANKLFAQTRLFFIKGDGTGFFDISTPSNRCEVNTYSADTDCQVRLGDLDNDMDLDAILVVYTFSVHNIYAFQNNGSAPFSSIISPTPSYTSEMFVGNDLNTLTVADFNVDGILDLAFTDVPNATDVCILINTTTSASAPPDNNIVGDDQGSYLICRSDAVLKKTSNFTVEGWFRFRNPSVILDNQYFFYNGNIGASNGFGLYLSSSGSIFINASGTPINTGFILASTDNRWHHFAVVNDATGEWHFYLDGVKNTGNLGNAPVATPTTHTVFFKNDDNNLVAGSLRNASLQEFRFWRIALTQEIIREFMHAQVSKSHPKYFALDSYVPMDRTAGNGDIAYTISPFARHRVITMENLGSMQQDDSEVAPIGDGGSAVSVSGSADFNARPQVDILIDFDNTGTFPNGNIYISRIYDNMPDDFYPNNPALVYSKVFWVFRQYGGNPTFSPVDEIEIDIKEDQFRSGLYPILNTPSDPNPLAEAFKIFMRPIGVTSQSAWVQVGQGAGFGSVKARRPASTVNEFGRELVVGVDASILPVRLVSFSGKKINTTTNLLEWVTSFEFNNEVFEVEKSYDGKNFFKIGFVAGKDKATNLNKYEFRDVYGEASAYYRLTQKDRSGKKNYTQTIYISAENGRTLFAIHPNPASDRIQLRLPSLESIEWNLKLYDLQGNLLVAILGDQEKLEQKLNEKLPDLSKGVYIVNLSNGEVLWNSKLVKQ
ncbi:MAG: FG-GAP-like repeat-containing protein [Raineya sp.]|nr:FG-GAP-like repeat-containing protein [Raineya sp.]